MLLNKKGSFHSINDGINFIKAKANNPRLILTLNWLWGIKIGEKGTIQ